MPDWVSGFFVFRFFIHLCANIGKSFLSPNREAMSEIDNAGNKGYCLMWFFIFLFLFVILVVGIYQYNGNFLPGG